jgi:hypothetical protein
MDAHLSRSAGGGGLRALGEACPHLAPLPCQCVINVAEVLSCSRRGAEFVNRKGDRCIDMAAMDEHFAEVPDRHGKPKLGAATAGGKANPCAARVSMGGICRG